MGRGEPRIGHSVVTVLMKGAAVDCKVPPRKVGTHSIRISGATALLLAGVPPATVQIMGRWASNAFIGYTRYQAELMVGISKRMVDTVRYLVDTHYVVGHIDGEDGDDSVWE